MAKRSPILGYNHNVRYRGLVFHVQTEDSGVLSPHMFTHLFHAGVIVSTRKLVYDAGSAEESIKSLMQAQHKAVLKDLRRGHFDDKIDEYLGGTDGLLPRGTVDEAAQSEPKLARASAPEVATEPTPRLDLLTLAEDDGKTRRDDARHDPTIPDVRIGLEPGAVTAHAMNNATIRTQAPSFAEDRTPVPREFADSAPEIEIQLELDESDEEPAAPPRGRPRDTDLALHGTPALDEHTRPTIDVSQLSDGVPASGRHHPGESIPPLPPPPGDLRRTPSAGVGASALPPGRPISRPPSRPAITPPQVVSRPLSEGDARARGHSDAVEVYAPAPPSAETPPGMRGAAAAAVPVDDRPGQYSQHKRGGSQKIPIEPPPIPPGLNRTGRASSQPAAAPARPTPGSTSVPRDLRPETAPHRPTPGSTSVPRDLRPETAPFRPTPGSTSVPRDLRDASPVRPPRDPSPMRPPRDPSPVRPAAVVRSGPGRSTPSSTPVPSDLRPEQRPRTLTPTRASPPAARTGSPNNASSGGVVMTRPAVIVGVPAKTQTQPRIRKAREDEGRGFGQGLISEKSLDEVILAYLSEDADEK